MHYGTISPAEYQLLAGLFTLCVKLNSIILWIYIMFICIGGDLDGEVVNNREGTFFKASEIDTDKESTYNRQTYIIDGNTVRFWLCAELPYVETTKVANQYLVERFRNRS